jgi:hypothetical protein
VKWFKPGLTVVLLCVGALGVVGCGTDNDTEATQLAKSIGDPGKPDDKGLPKTVETPPQSQEEFFKRQLQHTKEQFKKGPPAGAGESKN